MGSDSVLRAPAPAGETDVSTVWKVPEPQEKVQRPLRLLLLVVGFAGLPLQLSW